MIVKGIITAIDFTGNTCTVRMPQFETAGNDEITGVATVSNTPGSFNGYKVGDVVWVAFENGLMSNPVIIGKLYLGVDAEKADPRGVINVESSTATKNASIPADTKLSASFDNKTPTTAAPFKTLSGLAGNLNSLGNEFNTQVQSIVSDANGMRSVIEQNAADISAKVDKENNGLKTGFGWTLDDNAWTISAYDEQNNGLKDIDIFKVDRGGVTVAGEIKITGYPTKTVILYAQNSSRTTPPDFPADSEELVKIVDGQPVPIGSNFPNEMPTGYGYDVNNKPDGWSINQPAWAQSKYIWQKTIVFRYQSYRDLEDLDDKGQPKTKLREIRESTTVCISGADGQSGTSGADGQPAVSYWLRVSTPIHTGTNQDADIVITAMKQIGDQAGETLDGNAYLRYSWDGGTTWADNDNNEPPTFGWANRSSITIAKANVINADLLVQATHATSGNDRLLYESETITYAPVDTPIIDLDNDSAAIPYYGDIKLTDNNEVATSTATVYLGTTKVAATYQWSIVDNSCTISIEDPTKPETVTVTGLLKDKASVVCTATCTNIKDNSGANFVLRKTFNVSKQLSAARFWLATSAPVHAGTRQKTAVEISPMRKIADEAEEVDTTAYIRYKWGVTGSWTNWLPVALNNSTTPPTGVPFTIALANMQDADLIIEATHVNMSAAGAPNSPKLYDSETMTFAPLDTPTLDLTNDTDAIAYDSEGKINNSDTVSTTARVFLNGTEITASCSFSWTLDGITNSTPTGYELATDIDDENVQDLNNKIIVKQLTSNKATATCTVANIPDYANLTLIKDFSIAKQIKGLDGSSSIKLTIENDYDSVPCNADGRPSYIVDNEENRNDWLTKTSHIIRVFEGAEAKDFIVLAESSYDLQNLNPSYAPYYVVTYAATDVTYPGTTIVPTGDPLELNNKSLTGYITGFVEDNETHIEANVGFVTYKLYKGATLLDTVKFEAVKIIPGYPGTPGVSATSYWLKISTPIHTGENQSDLITIKPFYKVGNGLDLFDNAASIRWKYDEAGATYNTLTKNVSTDDFTISKDTNTGKYRNANILIQALHEDATTHTYVEYETETITYSPLNTPVLDLSNDTDTIAYHSTGTAKVNNADTVTSTATAYINGSEIGTAQYKWILDNCTANNSETETIGGVSKTVVNRQTIVVTGIDANERSATAKCIVSNIGYNGLTLEKAFTITKALQGKSIEDVGEYYLISASDDPTDLPPTDVASNFTDIPLPATEPAAPGAGEEPSAEYTAYQALVGKWNSNIVQATQTRRYLWNIEKIVLSDSTQFTQPAIIAMWAEDGRGIASIENFYCTNSYTSINEGENPGDDWEDWTWVSQPVDVDSDNRFLWNYEVITYTKGSPLTESTTPSIIGAYGQDAIDYDLIPSYQYIRIPKGDNPTPVPSTITVTARTTIGKTISDFVGGRFKAYKEINGETTCITSDGAFNSQGNGIATFTINSSTINDLIAGGNKIKVELYARDGNNSWIPVDQTDINVLRDGQDGEPGESATATHSISIRNDYVSVPVDGDGNMLWGDYSPDGTPLSNEQKAAIKAVWQDKTNHTVYCYEGSDLIPLADLTIGVDHNDVATGYYLEYSLGNWVEDDGYGNIGYEEDSTETTEYGAYTAFVYDLYESITDSNITENFTSAHIQYTLYKDGSPVAFAKFELAKLSEGQNATTYWLNVSSPVHLGINQQETITITPYYKVGEHLEQEDTSAYIRYNCNDGQSGSWTAWPNNGGAVTIPVNSFINKNIRIEATHNKTASPVVVYANEVIEYSNPDSITLSLNRDSATITYEENQKTGPDATCSATVYKGLVNYSAGAQFVWEINGCTATNQYTTSGHTYVNGQSITVTGILNGYEVATATVTATMTGSVGYPAIYESSGVEKTLTKTFTIAKQLKGENAVSYWIDASATQVKRTAGSGATNTPNHIYLTFKQQVGDNAPIAFGENTGANPHGWYKITIDGQPYTEVINGDTVSVFKCYTANITNDGYDNIGHNIDISNATQNIFVELFYEQACTTRLDSQTITITKDGEKGATGQAAYSLILDNDYDSIPCNFEGTPSYDETDWEDQTGHNITAYEGITSRAFTIDNALPNDPNPNTYYVIYNTNNVVWHSGSSLNPARTAYLTWETNNTETTGSVTYTLYKGSTELAVASFEVAKIIAGKDGEDAVDYYILSDVSHIKKLKNNTLSPSSVVFNFYKKDGNQAPVDFVGAKYRYKIDNGNWIPSSGYTTLNSSTSSFTCSSLTTSNSKVTVELYATFTVNNVATDVLVDRESIMIIAEGIDGTSPYKLTIENDFDSIPCNSAGNYNANYAFNTETLHHITAFEGTQQISFTVSSSIPTSGTGYVVYYDPHNVTDTDKPIIVDNNSSIKDSNDNTKYLKYSAYIQALTADTGYITYTLYKGTTAYDSVKFEASKLKAGENAIDYYILPNVSQVRKPKNASALDPTTITFNFYKKEGNGGPTDFTGTNGAKYRYSLNGGTDWVPTTGYTALTGANSSFTYTPVFSSFSSILVELYANIESSDHLVDKETVRVITDGADATAISAKSTKPLYVKLPTGATVVPNNIKPQHNSTTHVNNYTFTLNGTTYTWSTEAQAWEDGYEWWTCQETEFTDDTCDWSTPVKASALNQTIALAQGKTTNYYSDYDPRESGANVQHGDCWFDSGYTITSVTNTSPKDDKLGKWYTKPVPNMSQHTTADDYIDWYIVKDDRLILVAADNVQDLVEDNYLIAGITWPYSSPNKITTTVPIAANATGTIFCTTGSLNQWNEAKDNGDGTFGGWEDIESEMVYNKLTANYINAMDITAKNITVYDNSGTANTDILFKADSDNHVVKIVGFDAGYDNASRWLKYGTIGSSGSVLISPGYTATIPNIINSQETWTFTSGGNFGVTNDGTVYAHDIQADGGTLGNFALDSTSIHTKDATDISPDSIWFTTGKTSTKPIGGKYFRNNSIEKWFLTAGQNFGVSTLGNIYTNNATILASTLKLGLDKANMTSEETPSEIFTMYENMPDANRYVSIKSGGTVSLGEKHYTAKLSMYYCPGNTQPSTVENYIDNIGNGRMGLQAVITLTDDTSLDFDIKFLYKVVVIPASEPDEDDDPDTNETINQTNNDAHQNALTVQRANPWPTELSGTCNVTDNGGHIIRTRPWEYNSDLGYIMSESIEMDTGVLYDNNQTYSWILGSSQGFGTSTLIEADWPAFPYEYQGLHYTHSYNTADVIVYFSGAAVKNDEGEWEEITANNQNYSVSIDDIGATITITSKVQTEADLLFSGNLVPEYEWRETSVEINGQTHEAAYQYTPKTQNLGSYDVRWNIGYINYLQNIGLKTDNIMPASSTDSIRTTIGTKEYPYDAIYVRKLYVNEIVTHKQVQVDDTAFVVSDTKTVYNETTGNYEPKPIPSYGSAVQIDVEATNQNSAASASSTPTPAAVISTGLRGYEEHNAAAPDISTGYTTVALLSTRTWFKLECVTKDKYITAKAANTADQNIISIILYDSSTNATTTLTPGLNILKSANHQCYLGISCSGISDYTDKSIYIKYTAVSSGGSSGGGSSGGGSSGSCFDAGTKVLMADQTEKNIEDIKENDYIWSYNVETKQFGPKRVKKAYKIKCRLDLVQLIFKDGTVLNTTMTHPFYTANGWVSLRPNYDYNAEYENLQDQFVEMMQIGQKFYKINRSKNKLEKVPVTRIRYRHGAEEDHYVYNLNIEEYNTFFTNGILGHNRKILLQSFIGGCFDAGTKILMEDGTEKNIEDITNNDTVLSYNETLHQIIPNRVLSVFAFTNQNNDLVTLTFNDGTIIHTTTTHPFLTTDGWVCLAPGHSTKLTTSLMQVGQQFYKTENNTDLETLVLTNIEYTPLDNTSHIVYNLDIDNHDTFFANKVVVHNLDTKN